MAGRVLTCAIALAIGVTSGGCSLRQDAAESGAAAALRATSEPLPADAWPSRWTDGLPQFRGVGVAEWVLLPGAAGTPAARDDGPAPVFSVTKAEGGSYHLSADLSAETVGRGWARWYGPAVSASRMEDWSGYLEVRTWVGTPRVEPPGAPAGEGDLAWANRLAEFARTAEFTARYRVLLPPGGSPKGVAVYLYSTGAPWKYESPVVDGLVRSGWAVVHPVILSFNYDSLRRRGDGAGGERPPMSPEECASITDQVFADVAYATEAAVTVARRDIAGLSRESAGPVVLVGTSLGAILAPGVAARLRDSGEDVRALALIGGGANFWGILQTSRIVDLGLDASPDENGHSAEDRYLSASRLDTYYAAAAVRDIPALVVSARSDGVVLPRYGDLLWERLGRPERWSAGYGHLLLFWNLPREARGVVEWVNETAKAGAGGVRSAAAPSS